MSIDPKAAGELADNMEASKGLCLSQADRDLIIAALRLATFPKVAGELERFVSDKATEARKAADIRRDSAAMWRECSDDDDAAGAALASRMTGERHKRTPAKERQRLAATEARIAARYDHEAAMYDRILSALRLAANVGVTNYCPDCAARPANEAEDASKTGPISHAEAKQIAYRFFNSLFNRGGEKARISIPADFKRDDDIRLIAYIEQQQNLAASDVARCERDGAALIAEERARQVAKEGWTPAHDATHTEGELAQAAIAYADEATRIGMSPRTAREVETWPWEDEAWKPAKGPSITFADSVRMLTKAGALLAAEIDRLSEWSATDAARAKAGEGER